MTGRLPRPICRLQLCHKWPNYSPLSEGSPLPKPPIPGFRVQCANDYPMRPSACVSSLALRAFFPGFEWFMLPAAMTKRKGLTRI